jgi:hypothetical protein
MDPKPKSEEEEEGRYITVYGTSTDSRIQLRIAFRQENRILRENSLITYPDHT